MGGGGKLPICSLTCLVGHPLNGRDPRSLGERVLGTLRYTHSDEFTRKPQSIQLVLSTCHHDHHHCRVAGDGRRVVAPPCPRSTARLQRSPIGRVESFRSWSSHLFRGRPGGRHHVRSGGRSSDTRSRGKTWSCLLQTKRKGLVTAHKLN